jgi:hypothetical protein
MGYVGLPLAMAAWEAGFPIVTFGIDPEKVRLLSAGEPYLKHVAPATLKQMAATNASPRRPTSIGSPHVTWSRSACCPRSAAWRAGPELCGDHHARHCGFDRVS